MKNIKINSNVIDRLFNHCSKYVNKSQICFGPIIFNFLINFNSKEYFLIIFFLFTNF